MTTRALGEQFDIQGQRTDEAVHVVGLLIAALAVANGRTKRPEFLPLLLPRKVIWDLELVIDIVLFTTMLLFPLCSSISNRKPAQSFTIWVSIQSDAAAKRFPWFPLRAKQ